MRRIALTTTLLLCSLPTFAAPPTDAEVAELMRVMRVREQIEGSLPQIDASVQSSAEQALQRRGRTLSPEERRAFAGMLDQTRYRVREALAWERVEPLFSDVYRKSFESEDIATIVAFYRSPAGMRLLDRMPRLVEESMKAMNLLLIPMLDNMQRDFAAASLQDALVEPPIAVDDPAASPPPAVPAPPPRP